MISRPFDPTAERMAILADGSFGVLESKLAAALLRYRAEHVGCVIDADNAGRDASDVVGVGRGVPVVADLQAAMAYTPTLLTLGIAPPGGGLPAGWRAIITQALSSGLHIMSGLHQFLADDEEFNALANASGCGIWDVRRPPDNLPIGTRRALEVSARRVLTVGSDCRTGKMVTSLQLLEGARARGWDAAFCATGQIGMMIAGSGIAVDAVVSDFIAGATEERARATDAEWLFVEGQGALTHPAYSGVTLGLLHGCIPDAMILCHQPTRTRIARQTLEIPSLQRVVSINEEAASWMRPAPVVGVALNTFDLSDDDARAAVRAAEAATGLPTTDTVRFGVEPLLDALSDALPNTQSEAPR